MVRPEEIHAKCELSANICVLGAFQIYRAPGSVAFLRSGSALQPILPKSQAWCLDEQSSKFVLQIRRPNFWRIEVPVSNDEEVRRALVLREVLDKVLQFEKTPCPFERSFTVELPERPKTPIKKRTWTPPARTVSMNWPPGQPVTPPPEFPSRTRFYNPGARRFSDFGVDTSKMGLTPATSPQKIPEQQEEEAKSETPSRRARFENSPNMCKPLLEEPEPLSPPPSSIPLSIAQLTEQSSSPSAETVNPKPAEKPFEPTAPSRGTETQTTQIPIRKREPIWISKKIPPAARKAGKPAITKTQPAEPATLAASQSTASAVTSHRAELGPTSPETEDLKDASPCTKEYLQKDTNDESGDERGALEGSGQLHVRRTRVAAFASRRAATTPTLRLKTSSSSTLNSVQEQASELGPEEPAEPGSPADSMDSFFSVESWHSPLSPPVASPLFSPSKTYPYPHENIPLNNGQVSGFTTTPTISGWDRNSIGAVAGSGAQTPNTPFTDVHDELDIHVDKSKLESPDEDHKKTTLSVPMTSRRLPKENTAAVTDTDSLATSWSSAASRASSRSNTPMRHRASTTSVAISHRSPRALSPLPPAANLLTTDLSRASSTVRAIRRIPSSIFNKTCEILISPPAHLVSLMLRVAEQISAGEWRGFVFGMGDGGEVFDVRWDWTDDADLGGGVWEEPDYDFGGKQHRACAARKSRASFAAADLSRPSPVRRKVAEYQDPWATPPEEPDMDEEEHWSRSWGVD